MIAFIRQWVSSIVFGAGIGLLYGLASGLVEVFRQGYLGQGWHVLIWPLLLRHVTSGIFLTVCVVLVLMLILIADRKILGDQRRAYAAWILTLIVFLAGVLFSLFYVPRLLGRGGPLPFFCDNLAAFAVFLRRGVVLKMDLGPLQSPAVWGAFGGWLIFSLGLGLGIGRLIPRGGETGKFFPTTGRRLKGMGLIIAIIWSGLALVALIDRPSAPKKPNILLISVDTMRADRLGCYGGPARTKNMDALAAQGLKIEQAFSPSPWTLPAHAAMLTGVEPTVEGITGVSDALYPRLNTLSEALAAAGYRTAGFTSHLFVSQAYGFDQGFDHFEYVPSERAHDVAVRAEQWIPETKRPWFVFCHFFDPHWPYTPQREPPAVTGNAGLIIDLLQTADYGRALKAAMTNPVLARQVWLPRYDAELEEVDEAVGELRGALERRGLTRNTIIMIVSDHGEVFGEYPAADQPDGFDPRRKGPFGHGITCQPEAIRVPWIMAGPGAKAWRVDNQVDLTDLPALVFRMIGLPAPASFHQLSPAWQTDDRTVSKYRPLVADTFLGGKPRFGVFCGAERLFTPVEVSYQGLSLSLPGVRQSTLGRNPDGSFSFGCLEQTLQVYLSRLATHAAKRPTKRLTPAEKERLRSLGYIGREP